MTDSNKPMICQTSACIQQAELEFWTGLHNTVTYRRKRVQSSLQDTVTYRRQRVQSSPWPETAPPARRPRSSGRSAGRNSKPGQWTLQTHSGCSTIFIKRQIWSVEVLKLQMADQRIHLHSRCKALPIPVRSFRMNVVEYLGLRWRKSAM